MARRRPFLPPPPPPNAGYEFEVCELGPPVFDVPPTPRKPRRPAKPATEAKPIPVPPRKNPPAEPA